MNMVPCWREDTLREDLPFVTMGLPCQERRWMSSQASTSGSLWSCSPRSQMASTHKEARAPYLDRRYHSTMDRQKRKCAVAASLDADPLYSVSFNQAQSHGEIQKFLLTFINRLSKNFCMDFEKEGQCSSILAAGLMPTQQDCVYSDTNLCLSRRRWSTAMRQTKNIGMLDPSKWWIGLCKLVRLSLLAVKRVPFKISLHLQTSSTSHCWGHTNM